MSTVDLAVLILRLGAGITFAAHGAQKAFGWWGGPGPTRWHAAIEHMGFRPARTFAIVSMLAELVGGLLLLVGFLTPVAAAILLAQSIVIIFHVHWPKGFFSTQGGYEFPLVLAVVAIAVGLIGAGSISVDAALHIKYADTVKIALLALGVIGGIVALAIPRLAHEPAAAARG